MIDSKNRRNPDQSSYLESDLSNQSTLYRLLARSLPDTTVILFDHNLDIHAAEGQALPLFALDHADLEGKNLHDILPDGVASRDFLRQCQQALQGHAMTSEQYFNDVCFRIQMIPVPANNGIISSAMIVAQNIHAHKVSEQALQVSEERNRALLNALPDTMLVIRQDGTITELYSSPEISGFRVEGFAPGSQLHQTQLPPDIVEEILIYIQLALSSQQIQSFAFAISHETGSESVELVQYEARLLALNADEVLVLLRDITALKRIQDELRRHIEDLTIVRQVNIELADNLNFSYVVQLALDATLRLSKAQSGFIALLQEDGTLGLSSVIGAYDIRTLRRMIRKPEGVIARVLHSQQPELVLDVAQDPDYIVILPDTYALMVIPLVSNDRLVGILYLETPIRQRFNQDRFQFLQLITGRIAAYLDNANLYYQTQEQLGQLQKLYAEVAQLAQLKTDMIRVASHDLKNPLAWIIGYLDFFRMDMNNLTSQQKSYLENIENAARRMQRITSSILSLERIEQMAQEHTREEVDLTSLLKHTMHEQMDQIVRKQQTLQQVLPDHPVMITADPIQIREACANLIGNAIKYTPERGIITISLRSTPEVIEVRVEDTGYGIPEEQQSRLFTPFFRVITDETRAIEGTGLGLHLVRNIIERHRGKMFVHSIYGQGSTFGFDLPLLPEQPDESLPGSMKLD